LEPGSSTTFDQATFKCSAPGVFKFTITTDSKKAIKESNEENNIKTLEIKCTDKDGKMPDEEDDEKDDKSNIKDSQFGAQAGGLKLS